MFSAIFVHKMLLDYVLRNNYTIFSINIGINNVNHDTELRRSEQFQIRVHIVTKSCFNRIYKFGRWLKQLFFFQ